MQQHSNFREITLQKLITDFVFQDRIRQNAGFFHDFNINVHLQDLSWPKNPNLNFGTFQDFSEPMGTLTH